MRAAHRIALTSLLSLLLAACATTRPPRQAPPPVTTPAAPATTPPPLPAPLPPAEAQPPDLWQQLRDSFAMDDCDSDPQIDLWARRFTHSPRRFEAKLADVLPRLVYVQQAARQHEVAGEFALLPWVESRFAAVPARGKGPAGMWQIMPITARTLDLKISGGYDGRLDVPVATEAVMVLLQRYHKRFDDWRLVDYAYNRGQYRVRRLIREHGTPPATPTIPDLPVRRITREHLIKLLAIACVIRQPDRFQVHLPTLPAARQLVTVRVAHSMTLAAAAAAAGMPLAELKRFNRAADKLAQMPSPHLLLPREHADRLLLRHPESAYWPADDAPAPGQPGPAHGARHQAPASLASQQPQQGH